MPEPRLPPWIRVKIPIAGPVSFIESSLRTLSLNTVCESAFCPNRGECFGRGTVTFMILGNICTRNCPFCAVEKGRPLPPDPSEPQRIAQAVSLLGLKHVVITSVDRDDLSDFGAGHFAEVIKFIKANTSNVTVEVLVPDFQGVKTAIDQILDSAPDIFNHNLETVPRLHSYIKPKSVYQRSLDILQYVKKHSPNIYTKSGLMVGLGETQDEIFSVMKDLRRVNCDMLTIGQYLKPPGSHLEVKEFIKPETFTWYNNIAKSLGFIYVAAAPLVRSSYNAAEARATLPRLDL